jgi:hypothetical protein
MLQIKPASGDGLGAHSLHLRHEQFSTALEPHTKSAVAEMECGDAGNSVGHFLPPIFYQSILTPGPGEGRGKDQG